VDFGSHQKKYLGKLTQRKELTAQERVNFDLIYAAFNDNIKGMQQALHAGADINFIEKNPGFGLFYDRNALITAIDNDNLSAVRFLVAQGADQSNLSGYHKATLAMMLEPGYEKGDYHHLKNASGEFFTQEEIAKRAAAKEARKSHQEMSVKKQLQKSGIKAVIYYLAKTTN